MYKHLLTIKIYRYLGSIRPKKNKKGTAPDKAQETEESCDQKAVIEELISKEEVVQGEWIKMSYRNINIIKQYDVKLIDSLILKIEFDPFLFL